MTKRIKGVIFFALTACLNVTAQPSGSLSSSEIIHKLKKLNTVGSVLYIAAHPDDENTRLLAYLANERNLRTGYLSLTRGDGGQNLIGKEQGELLGLVRTQELLAARRTDGAAQFFTRANDFGFSKSPDESLTIWNKDSVLADVVWTIRRFKPDVIICRFPTTGEGGHGHHTASAILALEAFDAAADPERFPEQLAFTEVWQTRRILWNTFNFGGNNTTAPNQKKLDVGGYNPLLGKSYGEISASSRSMHKSQGFGTAKARGESIEYFKQLKGDTIKTDLFEGINPTWTRFPSTSKFSKILDHTIQKFDPQFPEKTIPDLITFYKQIQALDETNPNIRYWKKLKTKETEDLLLACSGIFIEAIASDFIGIPGNAVSITSQFISRNHVPVTLNKIRYWQSDTLIGLTAKQNVLYTFRHSEKLPTNAPFSSPFWLNESHSNGMYKVKNQLQIGQTENEPSTKVYFDITIQGLPLQVERGVVYKSTDPVKGEVYRPLEILPLVTINLSEKVYVFPDLIPKKIRCVVKSNVTDINGTLELKVPEGWTATVTNPNFSLKGKGNEAVVEAIVSKTSTAANGKISASVNVNGISFNKSISRIEYDHIPYQFILSDAEATLVVLDLKKAGNRIGYIPGAGDDVMTCLKQIGYDVTPLTDEILSNGDLSVYDAIVTGVRAYNINERLQVHYPKIMDYVSNGGNLIVQYNTNNRIGPLVAKIGPYPFTISRDRVTNENAEVQLLEPTHPAFHFPNEINKTDFENWIQERGTYFATDVDPHYEKLLSMNDPNEKPSQGSLIIAKYGKGNFVYTGLVFFRELPAGVPGAYRLFANLLGLPKNK